MSKIGKSYLNSVSLIGSIARKTPLSNYNDQILAEKFKQLLQQYPKMTAQGIGVSMYEVTGITKAELFAAERKKLEDSLDAFNFSYEMLINLEKHEREEFATHNSYHNASMYEREINFPIPEGALILAALAVGFTIDEVVYEMHVTLVPPA